jgi:hypothetical protein
MAKQDDEPGDRLAKQTFLITMVGAAVYIAVAFLWVIL